MSGHSKWAQIKRSKGAADQKRGLLFSKLAKKISIAVKEGGGSGDPSINFKLKSMIEYTKAQGMPSDNIERAIKSATGGLVKDLKEIVYEGYGPFASAFLVECATDNTNRTLAEVRKIFEENGGSLGTPGTVAWQFQTKGQILIERDQKSDETELKAIDLGVEDVVSGDEGLEIITSPENFEGIKKELEKISGKIISAQIVQKSSQTLEVDDVEKEKIEKFIEELESCEDVLAVSCNINL